MNYHLIGNNLLIKNSSAIINSLCILSTNVLDRSGWIYSLL